MESAPIDDARLDALSAHPRLERLALAGDAPTSLAPLARLPKLRSLRVAGGRFRDLAAVLWRRPNLRFVALENGGLADAPGDLVAGGGSKNRLDALRAYCEAAGA